MTGWHAYLLSCREAETSERGPALDAPARQAQVDAGRTQTGAEARPC